MTKKHKSITWSNMQDTEAQLIVDSFGDEMESMDIKPRTATRPSGATELSASGIVRFAMFKLAEQARKKGKSK